MPARSPRSHSLSRSRRSRLSQAPWKRKQWRRGTPTAALRPPRRRLTKDRPETAELLVTGTSFAPSNFFCLGVVLNFRWLLAKREWYSYWKGPFWWIPCQSRVAWYDWMTLLLDWLGLIWLGSSQIFCLITDLARFCFRSSRASQVGDGCKSSSDMVLKWTCVRAHRSPDGWTTWNAWASFLTSTGAYKPTLYILGVIMIIIRQTI